MVLQYSKIKVNILTVLVVAVIILAIFSLKQILAKDNTEEKINNISLNTIEGANTADTVYENITREANNTEYNNYDFYKYYYNYYMDYIKRYTDVKEGIPKIIIPKIALVVDIIEETDSMDDYAKKYKNNIWLETSNRNIKELSIGDYIIYVENSRVYLFSINNIVTLKSIENLDTQNKKRQMSIVNENDDGSITNIQAVKIGG